MFCAFLSSFSLLSQVLSLSSTLLTPSGAVWVFHIAAFFFFFSPPTVIFCPHQNRLPRTHLNSPQDASALSVSSHSPPLNFCHMLLVSCSFFTFFFFNWGELLTRLRRSLADCTCDSRASEGFSAELSERENPRFWKRRRRPGGCSAALTLWFLRCRRFVSPPRCNGGLNQEDSFWSQALQDLQTCGQSEILRELEVGHPHPPTHFLCPK